MSTTMVTSIFFLAFARKVAVWELLILDALLDVLIVEVEVVDAVVRAVPLVVVGNDGLERLLFLPSGSCRLSSFSWGRSSWICWTSLLPSAGGEKNCGDLEGNYLRVGGLARGLELFLKTS
ncbi:hypothetical protein QW131_10165 [Roseibium salinum]|nr:hypothetical protein [Roseibium salinum]